MVVEAARNQVLPWVAGAVVVLAVLVVLLPGWLAVVPAAALALIATWCRRRAPVPSSTLVAALSWCSVGIVSGATLGLVWPIPQFVGLCLAALLLRRLGTPRPEWLGPGRHDRLSLHLAWVSVPLTTVALAVFIVSGRTDLQTATEGLQSIPLWVLPLAGVGFALLNPTVEEVLFRGVLQTMVFDVSARPALAIVVQGAAFGTIHLGGVPGGPLGMAMAGAWGAVLGVIRHRTGSIRLPWLVHACANVVIFTTVVVMALSEGTL